MKNYNRPSPRYKGVFQRCREDCPPDRCRRHSWSYAAEVPTGSNGKRRQLTKGGFESARSAADERAEVLRQHRTGLLPEDTKITVGDYLPQWLAGKVKRRKIDASTALAYRHHIEAYLVPQLGHIRLCDLRGEHLTLAYERIVDEREAEIALAKARREQRLKEVQAENDRRRAQGKTRMRSTTRGMGKVPRPIGPATVQRIHSTMRAALRTALKNEKIPRDVAINAELPDCDKRKVIPPDIDQFWALLDLASDHRLYPLMLLAGNSGLRRGELVGLRWADLDWDSGRLVVTRQRKVLGYQVVETDVKTNAGQDRVVVLGERTLRALKAWQGQQEAEREEWGPAYRDDGYMFTWEDGRPFHPDYISKTVGKLMRRAGIVMAKLHALRHFYAAVLIAAGYDIEAISKALGHSSVAITSAIYGSLLRAVRARMANDAEALVWGDRGA